MAMMTVIAKHSNVTTGVALASYDTFLAEAGVPRATAQRVVKKLVDAGYLTHTKGTCTYRLGPKVQTFLDKPTADQPAKTFGKQQAAPAAATGWMQQIDHK
jgi:DNA-binding transcriptional regulator YhcF (GntR family)